MEGGVLSLGRAANFGGGAYAGQTELRGIEPGHRGRVLVRGGQIDGSHDMRISIGPDPLRDVTFRADGYDPGGWSEGGHFVRVIVPGCYAYQIDRKEFSENIIFQAVLSS
jgi:hypothetical protein